MEDEKYSKIHSRATWNEWMAWRTQKNFMSFSGYLRSLGSRVRETWKNRKLTRCINHDTTQRTEGAA